jgi:hypothetical protein
LDYIFEHSDTSVASAGFATSTTMSITNEKEHSETVEVQDGQSNGSGITWTPEEEKKLVRKIDLLLLPTIWIMYLLSYMDRTKCVLTFLPFNYNGMVLTGGIASEMPK